MEPTWPTPMIPIVLPERSKLYFSANSVNVSSRSQSAGGVSESESFVVRSVEERASEVDEMLKDYLLNTTDDNGVPLLYRGLMS